MKILSHFSVFLEKFKAHKQNPKYWQNKYFLLIENFNVPAIEIYNHEIVHINKPARLLLNLNSFSKAFRIEDFFDGSIKIENQKNVSDFILRSKNKQIVYNASLLYQFSKSNFIISLYINRENLPKSLGNDVFKGFFDNSLEGICLVDENGIIIEWNQAMSAIFEVPREKYLNKPMWMLEYDFLPAARKNETTKNELLEIINNFLNKKSNETHIEDYEREINHIIKYIHYRIFPIQTEKGRLFGRINLDLTKRKSVELELKKYQEHLEQLVHERTLELQKSEARIHLLMKSLPLAYYSYNPDNQKERTWYSENIEILSGYKNLDYARNAQHWLSQVHPEDQKRIKEATDQIETKGHLNCEYRWINAQGKTIWVLDQAVIINQKEAQQKLIIGCILDITEHKESENAIIENERNYREIFNSSIDAIFIHNVDTGKIEDVNDTMLKMYRCTFEDILKYDINGFSSNQDPYDKENSIKQIQIAKEKGINQFEWLAKRKDGTTFWAEIILKLVKLNGIDKIIAVVRDTDEKKNAESQIKYRSDFEELIFSISSAFYDLPSTELEKCLNNALEKICEFIHSDLAYIYFFGDNKMHSKVSYFWHNDKIDIRREIFQNIDYNVLGWHTNQIFSNLTINAKSIDSLPAEAETFKKFIKVQGVNSFLSVPLNYQGKIIGFIGLAANANNRDWNEDEKSLLLTIGQTFINNIIRKDSLDALRESEQTHREILNATTEAIIVIDIETGKFLDVNKAMLDMFGLTYDEAITLDPATLTFPTGEFTKENMQLRITQTLNERPQVFEWLVKKKDGTEFWIEVSLRSAEINGIKRVLSVLRDITERKNTQEIIRQNEEKYRLLIEGQTDLVVKLTKEKKLLFVSPSFCELFGKSESELVGSEFILPVHQQDKSVTIAILELLNNAPHTCYLEHRTFTKHGWRWIAWNSKAILDENEKLIEIIAVGRDITYQKGVEDALRRSEDRFRSIVQQLSDIVFIIDKNNIFLYDTPSVKNVLGYNEGELIGINFLELVHSDDLESTKERLNELININSQFITHEMRVRHADGRWISIEAIGRNMLHHTSIKGLVITCRDITERKHIETRILDAIIKTEEHERERFAKNLHDDLGPLLSSIKMYINSFTTSNEIKKQEYIINQLNEIVKEAIITTKEVSNDLSPHILINYGLVSAIDSFLKKVPSSTNLIFENEMISERLSIHIENSTYRIIKELVNNSLKHANAKTIKIKLTEQNNYLNLFYSDDGIGFDMSELVLNKSKGMGFSNIISRAKALNGIYDFQTEPKKGFVFKIKIPIYQTSE
jgi:PAS domain S-box-containing protein